jgi:hypothetical protein
MCSSVTRKLRTLTCRSVTQQELGQGELPLAEDATLVACTTIEDDKTLRPLGVAELQT